MATSPYFVPKAFWATPPWRPRGFRLSDFIRPTSPPTGTGDSSWLPKTGATGPKPSAPPCPSAIWTKNRPAAGSAFPDTVSRAGSSPARWTHRKFRASASGIPVSTRFACGDLQGGLLDPLQLPLGHPGRQGNVPVLDHSLLALAGEHQLDEFLFQGGLLFCPELKGSRSST